MTTRPIHPRPVIARIAPPVIARSTCDEAIPPDAGACFVASAPRNDRGIRRFQSSRNCSSCAICRKRSVWSCAKLALHGRQTSGAPRRRRRALRSKGSLPEFRICAPPATAHCASRHEPAHATPPRHRRHRFAAWWHACHGIGAPAPEDSGRCRSRNVKVRVGGPCLLRQAHPRRLRTPSRDRFRRYVNCHAVPHTHAIARENRMHAIAPETRTRAVAFRARTRAVDLRAPT